LWAADYRFVGTWKVNPSKSTLIDQMKVVAVGPNKYAFTFEGTDAETIVVDGTDQPGLGGTVLTFLSQLQKLTKNVKFDGKDYPNEGPNAAPGSASSARLVSRHVVQMTDKVKGKIVDTRKITLSPDLKTLTMTVYPLGQVNPNVYVFDRE
jgi:hypothetical protein